MREFDRITTYFAPLTRGQPNCFSLRNDGATLDHAPGETLVVTTDTLIESVHFPVHTHAADIATKALAVNLSDLAAMGATPLCYTLALSLPSACDDTWLREFSSTLDAMQTEHGIYLLGGDSTTSPAGIVLTLTAFGTVPEGGALTRSGAQAGDGIYVSGTIGDAALGLHALQHDRPAHALIARLHRPTPRLALGIALRDLATSCLDVSDGLVQDVGHLATASGLKAQIMLASIPHSDVAREYAAAFALTPEMLITGGDDYELAFTLPVGTDISHLQSITPITRIGTMQPGAAGVDVVDATGAVITIGRGGYQHA